MFIEIRQTDRQTDANTGCRIEHGRDAAYSRVARDRKGIFSCYW